MHKILKVYTGASLTGLTPVEARFNNLYKFPNLLKRIFLATPNALIRLNGLSALLPELESGSKAGHLDTELLLSRNLLAKPAIELPGKNSYYLCLNNETDQAILNEAIRSLYINNLDRKNTKFLYNAAGIDIRGEDLLSADGWRNLCLTFNIIAEICLNAEINSISIIDVNGKRGEDLPAFLNAIGPLIAQSMAGLIVEDRPIKAIGLEDADSQFEDAIQKERQTSFALLNTIVDRKIWYVVAEKRLYVGERIINDPSPAFLDIQLNFITKLVIPECVSK